MTNSFPADRATGSAFSVGAGLVPLSLGTDTAGSGRVPAAYNNIVGLKPSRGLVSAAGVVPACRTLDCVSVFALTVDDAMTALHAIAGADRADPFSRPRPLRAAGPMPERHSVRRAACAGSACSLATRLRLPNYDAALHGSGARRKNRRDRHGAVLRGGAVAL